MRSIALVVLLISSTSVSSAGVVYREDFVGEVGFPTSPEVDPTGVGGFLPSVGGDGPPANPTIDGNEATLNLAARGSTGPAGEYAGVLASGGAFGSSFGSFEVGATFRSFNSNFAGIGAVQANVGVFDDVIETVVRAVVTDSSSGILELVILEQYLDAAPGDNNQWRVTLPDTVRIATLGGAPLALRLFVDRNLYYATASFTRGANTYTTPALTLTRFGDRTIRTLASYVLVHDFLNASEGGPIDFGADDALSVELVELWATAVEPVPSIATTGQLALVFCLIGVVASVFARHSAGWRCQLGW